MKQLDDNDVRTRTFQLWEKRISPAARWTTSATKRSASLKLSGVPTLRGADDPPLFNAIDTSGSRLRRRPW